MKFGKWEHVGQTDQAVEFIDQSQPDRPFALFVSWHPPHNHLSEKPEDLYGYLAPQENLDRYDPQKLQLRPDQPDDERHRQLTRGYYALVDSIDECFGRITEALARKGLTDDTLVVFTSTTGTCSAMSKASASTRAVPNPPRPRCRCSSAIPATSSPGSAS